MKTHSFSARSFEEFKNKLSALLKIKNFKPALAFAFLSVDLPLGDISNEFKKNKIRLFGETSSGELLFNNIENRVFEKAGVFTLVDLAPKSFKTHLIERGDNDSYDFGKQTGAFIKEQFSKPSVIIGASGLDLDGQRFVEGIKETAGNNLLMFGGLAGDDGKFVETFVFDENKVSNGGAVVVVFDSNMVNLSGMATSGWVGLGMNLTITKSKGNVVYTVDNKPALDVYLEYLNIDVDDMPAIGLEYPLLIKREDNIDALRAVTGINKNDRSLLFAGSVPEGSTVMFSSSPGFEVIESTKSKVLDFADKHPKSDMFLLFSCVARHLALGPMVEDEIKLVIDKWNVPVAGFFTYGEIGTNPGKACDFYNQTYTLVSIKEIKN